MLGCWNEVTNIITAALRSWEYSISLNRRRTSLMSASISGGRCTAGVPLFILMERILSEADVDANLSTFIILH